MDLNNLYSYKIGVFRRVYRLNLDTEIGWRRLVLASHGVEFAISKIFNNYKVDLIGISIPIKFLAGTKKFLDGENHNWNAQKNIKT